MLQPGGKKADGRSGAVRIRQIVQYIGMIVLQAAVARIVAITLFGHRQRDNAGLRRGHGAEDGVGILWRNQDVPNGPDLACDIAIRSAFHRHIEAALRGERVTCPRALQADSRDPPIPAFRRHGLVCIGGNEGPEKGAWPQMHDSGERGGMVAHRAVWCGHQQSA